MMNDKHKVEVNYTKTEAIATCQCGWVEKFTMGPETGEAMHEWILKCAAHVPVQGEQKTSGQYMKKAIIRDAGYPVGSPAPMHINCECGTSIPVGEQGATCYICGIKYDVYGWIISRKA